MAKESDLGYSMSDDQGTRFQEQLEAATSPPRSGSFNLNAPFLDNDLFLGDVSRD